ncbi:MAG: DUF456 domain-containing protein [Balneolaceae bacterium]
MEILWIILGAIFIIIGLIGAFLPIIPGLPFSYLGLIILQLVYAPFTLTFFIVWGIIVALISFVLDSAIPAWSTAKFGGSTYGITGSVVGLVAGVFFPPLGFIFGPLIGAFIGEIIAGNKSDKALKSAFGAFIGFMAATGLKVIAAGVMAWYYFSNI